MTVVQRKIWTCRAHPPSLYPPITMNRFSLENRCALITGSGRGLGLRIAEGLAEAGARVVINDVDQARAEAAASALSRQGYSASTAIFNVTSRDEVRKAVSSLE